MLRKVSLVFQFACLVTSCYGAPQAELRAKLSAPVPHYSLFADNFIDAMTRVAQAFQIPMGIAWVDSAASRSKLNLQWDNTTVQQILQSIVSTQTGYDMTVGSDIVHVGSNQILPDQNFLLMRIKSFDVRNEVVEMAERKLGDLIRTAIAPARGGRGGVAGSLITRIGEPEISLRIDNATVEEILDSLATVSNEKIWIATFSDSAIPTTTGLRRTLTLWNNYPITDDQQPVWDMFGWNDSIPLTGVSHKP